MEYEVVVPVVVENGSHEGVIVDIQYRTEPYKYTDVVVEFKEGMRLNYGCPSHVSEVSKLGKLLKAFGAELVPGSKVDDKATLIGKQCVFMTLNEEKDGKTFARIVENSLRPKDEVKTEEIK